MNTLPSYNQTGSTEGIGQPSAYFRNDTELFTFEQPESLSGAVPVGYPQGRVSGSSTVVLSPSQEVELLEGLADLEMGRCTELANDSDIISFLKQ